MCTASHGVRRTLEARFLLLALGLGVLDPSEGLCKEIRLMHAGGNELLLPLAQAFSSSLGFL